jgi:hypothetical protein
VSFIGRYRVPLLYPTEFRRELQLLLCGAIVAVNALVDFFVMCRVENLRRSQPSE